jgi:4'-phosphopantetheinyl transferase
MMVNELKWHRAIPGKWTSSNEVHVWQVLLDVTAAQRERLLGVLSADEVERSVRLRFEKDQQRFITARGMLRQILGCYLGKNPHEIRFEYTAFGKPVLATNFGSDSLCFNLSHSDAFALFAFARGRNIGIDIERISDDVAVDHIARRFFSPGEISSLERTHENNRNELFFQYWTRKEAFLKATGEGISFPMEQLDVSLMRGRGLSPVALPGDTIERSRWYVQDLFPGPGYSAAIAVEGRDCDLLCRNYSV